MMNKVLLIGRLARDAELREFSNGGAIAILRVMTNRAWRDRTTGEMRERSEGHTVVVHAQAVARRLAETLKKGHMVYVEGMLENRNWQDTAGQTRYVTEVVVRLYLGTVRKVPVPHGTHTPAKADNTDSDSAITQHESPENAAEEIDFFADAALSGDDTFEF